MKLTPKPSAKAKSTSPESTSTKPIAKGSSTTRKTPIILTDAAYTGIDQQGQAVPTASQMAAENKKRTRSSIGIFFPAELDDSESEEARILGNTISQMPWLKWATDCPAVRLGVTQGEGEIEELGGRTIGQFDGAVLYRQPGNDDPDHTKMVRLEDLPQLKAFTTAAISELYRRGILV